MPREMLKLSKSHEKKKRRRRQGRLLSLVSRKKKRGGRKVERERANQRTGVGGGKRVNGGNPMFTWESDSKGQGATNLMTSEGENPVCGGREIHTLATRKSAYCEIRFFTLVAPKKTTSARGSKAWPCGEKKMKV